MKLEHYYSDFNGHSFGVQSPYGQKPSAETVREARTLGRVAVGNADIICQEDKYLVVIQNVSNGIAGNIYRDMYRIID